MTESEVRNHVVNTANSYLGCKESDGSHKKIIDLYNSHKPLARSYKVKYTDAWCATFVSAIAIKCGYTDIMPTECSCSKMIALYKAKGRWQESDSYNPKAGDIIMYDWDDSGKGDNTGNPDHVGIVVGYVGDEVMIIEGNYKNAVGYRTLKLNAKYIRGYCLPNYGSKATKSTTATKTNTVTIGLMQLSKGSKCDQVKAMQQLLIAKGYSCGGYGADGDFGDGTRTAVKKFQSAKGLESDGICGKNTWSKLLGV